MKQYGKTSQSLIILMIIVVTLILAIGLLWKKKSSSQTSGNIEESTATSDEYEAEKEERELSLTRQQLLEYNIKLDSVQFGQVPQLSILPGRLMVNTDQQAHVSPNFVGHVEEVNVTLGQTVQQGQALAVLTVPELVDQQANLRLAQASLDLAAQDLQRERQLWSQGISAKQDLQRAENAHRQAQISVQSLQSRLRALGASSQSNGRFVIRAPIAGMISQKDIVVGENVQLADQIFVIEQLKDLWLEFVLPAQQPVAIQPGKKLQFKSLQSDQRYSAVIQSLTSQADTQTGRLVVRAKVQEQAQELRPNLMVNVELQDQQQREMLRVSKQAIQNIEGKKSIFVVDSEQSGKIHFRAQPVEVGELSSDGQWIAVSEGLKQGQKYVSQGSFLLKSELEKGEAGHGH